MIDIALLYAPKLLPGFRVTLLVEEQLIMVRCRGMGGEAGPEEYVHVDWGPLFAAQYGVDSAVSGRPGLLVGLGPLGLSYILRVGGMGYFRKGAVAPHLASGEMERVEHAPEFTYPAYAVYAEEGEFRPGLQAALEGLRTVARW